MLVNVLRWLNALSANCRLTCVTIKSIATVFDSPGTIYSDALLVVKAPAIAQSGLLTTSA